TSAPWSSASSAPATEYVVSRPRRACADNPYPPGSSGTNRALYQPSSRSDHSIGTATFRPVGVVTCAVTDALFTSWYVESVTCARSVTGSPGPTRDGTDAIST